MHSNSKQNPNERMINQQSKVVYKEHIKYSRNCKNTCINKGIKKCKKTELVRCFLKQQEIRREMTN